MEYFQGRLLVEIVWPLLLFLILFLVRLRGLKKNHHECRRIFFLVLFIHCIGNILQVISRRRQCPQQDSSHSYRISSALLTIPVTSLCGPSQAGSSNTTNLCKFSGKKYKHLGDILFSFQRHQIGWRFGKFIGGKL